MLYHIDKLQAFTEQLLISVSFLSISSVHYQLKTKKKEVAEVWALQKQQRWSISHCFA